MIALEPAREDRQRALLKLVARYKGRGAALSHAELLTDLLRNELGGAPEPATRALIETIKRHGESEPKPEVDQPVGALAAAPAVPDADTISIAVHESAPPEILPAVVPTDVPAKQIAYQPRPFWRREVLGAAVAAGVIAFIAVLVPRNGGLAVGLAEAAAALSWPAAEP